MIQKPPPFSLSPPPLRLPSLPLSIGGNRLSSPPRSQLLLTPCCFAPPPLHLCCFAAPPCCLGRFLFSSPFSYSPAGKDRIFECIRRRRTSLSHVSSFSSSQPSFHLSHSGSHVFRRCLAATAPSPSACCPLVGAVAGFQAPCLTYPPSPSPSELLPDSTLIWGISILLLLWIYIIHPCYFGFERYQSVVEGKSH